MSIYSNVVVSLSVFLKAVVGLNTEQADASTHVFSFCSYLIMLNPFAWGVCGQLLNVMAKYTEESHITTVEEIKDFFHHIVYDLGINFHPDEDFKDYVSYETGERTMDDEQAELYNRLMDEAFEVCDNDQIYEIGSELLFERLQIEQKEETE